MSDDLSATKQIREGAKPRRARVLYSYSPMNDDELELQVNDIVKVIEEVEEGWWRGILKGKEGVFPSNFVVEDNSDVFEPSKGIDKQEEKECPLIDVTDGAKLSSPSHQEIKPKPVQGVGLGNIFQDGIKKLKPTEALSEKKPRCLLQEAGPPKKPPPPAPLENAPRLPPKPVREQARVLYPYDAQNEDELSLKEGDVINIISKEIEDKGWWKGELNGQIGVFPDNFVELVRAEEPQLRRPERPEKPSATVLGAKGIKQDLPEKLFPSQEASTDKSSKIPPPKPPAPLSSKRGSEEKLEKPSPPVPVKKPQVPPPMKKPSRSSLGPKPPPVNAAGSANVPSNQNSVQSPTSTQLTSSVLTNGTANLTDDTKAKSFQLEAQENIDEATFDAIESSPEKLTHLAASRAKAPNRRPPSRVFVNKENGKENGDICISQPAWVKDVSKGQSRISSQSDSTSGDKETVQTVEDQRKDSPKHKVPTPLSPTSRREEDSKITSKSPAAAASPAKEVSKKLSPVSVGKPEQGADSSNDIPSVASTDELSELRKEISLLKESSVKKSEFEELQKQVESLKEAVESQRSHFSKLVLDLISEIDEEKKLRLALEVQLDRIKKLTATV